MQIKKKHLFAERKRIMAEKKDTTKAPVSADKQEALKTAINQIEKQFGKGAIMRLGQTTALNVDAISTGSIALDVATGIGGLPKGRIV